VRCIRFNSYLTRRPMLRMHGSLQPYILDSPLWEAIRDMSSFLNSLNCYLFLHLIVLGDAKEIRFQHDSSMRFANFVEHKYRSLEVSKLSNTSVREFTHCAMECLSTPSCISLNIATSTDQRGTFWCELLLDDMFNNTQNFKENATSRHFSKWVS